ncbi:MAG: hypothetical protein ACLQVI_00705 [Polyangiaceae bacterium]
MKNNSARAAIYVRSSADHGRPAQEVLPREHAGRSGYAVSGVYKDIGARAMPFLSVNASR